MEICQEEGLFGRSGGHLEGEWERQGGQYDAVKRNRTGSTIKSMILAYTCRLKMGQHDAVKQVRTGSTIKSMILGYTWMGNMMH